MAAGCTETNGTARLKSLLQPALHLLREKGVRLMFMLTLTELMQTLKEKSQNSPLRAGILGPGCDGGLCCWVLAHRFLARI